jgi:hypothetical protein
VFEKAMLRLKTSNRMTVSAMDIAYSSSFRPRDLWTPEAQGSNSGQRKARHKPGSSIEAI